MPDHSRDTGDTYSPFPETADIETSNDDYATRFRGKTGAWMLDVQTRLTRKLLAPFARGTLLDVGGGHGQLAHPLADDGWEVTVLGSAKSCEHRIRDLTSSGRAKFVVGNVVELPFPAIAPMLFAAKKKLEKNTRHWRLFKHAEIDEAFKDADAVVAARLKQFALPMALHRALKCAPLSAFLEGCCRAIGFTALAGSPVVFRAEKKV